MKVPVAPVTRGTESMHETRADLGVPAALGLPTWVVGTARANAFVPAIPRRREQR